MGDGGGPDPDGVPGGETDGGGHVAGGGPPCPLSDGGRMFQFIKTLFDKKINSRLYKST